MPKPMHRYPMQAVLIQYSMYRRCTLQFTRGIVSSDSCRRHLPPRRLRSPRPLHDRGLQLLTGRLAQLDRQLQHCHLHRKQDWYNYDNGSATLHYQEQQNKGPEGARGHHQEQQNKGPEGARGHQDNWPNQVPGPLYTRQSASHLKETNCQYDNCIVNKLFLGS